jgi:transcriptional regulator with XRE-family HTH domain
VRFADGIADRRVRWRRTPYVTTPEWREQVMDFGTRLRTWRLDADLSQRELAKRADINFSYLSKIEAGLVPPPSDEKVRSLARALGRSYEEVEEILVMSEESRVPAEVVKAALIRNPGVGALLRRLKDRRLSDDELNDLLRIVEQRPDKVP